MASTSANSPTATTRKGKQAKQNYIAQRIGNNKGSISFGTIHKEADVTSGVMLNTPDGHHQMYMDIDGPRKGWTTFTGPGKFQVECGRALEESQSAMMFNAKNGDIHIVATNGKIRMQATDIELIAVGEGGSKGNIRLQATENISSKSKKFLVDAKTSYKIVTAGTGTIIANSILKCYGSIFAISDDSCALKDSKVGSQKIQREANAS
tara:strand:- start:558 stop:1181 length:624 start_codon:yes stop_codon:yes gene_type:complete